MSIEQIALIVFSAAVVGLTGWLCLGVLRQNEGNGPEEDE